jgi:predicted phosphodiesterase
MKATDRTIKGELIIEYLREFPNHSNLGIARLAYSENKAVFKDVEDARRIVRYYKGAVGKTDLSSLSTTDFLSPTKLAEKYSLPASYETIYEPFEIKEEKILILSDIHIPYHSVEALELTFDWAKENQKQTKRKWDAILLNGDILDCYQLSSFDRDPRKRSFKNEIRDAKQFLKELKRVFDCKIYWKEGNHEERYSRFLKNKAPELLGIEEYELQKLLKMDDYNCTWIDGKRVITFDKLNIIHGHEYKAGIGGGGVNPARGMFLRGKGNAVCGHWHQSSEHTEPTIDGRVIKCWSIGCLSELNPHYMPLNRWNHGFGEAIKTKSGFHFENHTIVKGTVF